MNITGTDFPSSDVLAFVWEIGPSYEIVGDFSPSFQLPSLSFRLLCQTCASVS